MSLASLFSASFCPGEEVARGVAARLGCVLLTDEALAVAAAPAGPLPAEKLLRALHGPPALFQRVTHERERALACLRSALAARLGGEGFLLLGFAAHLLPRSLTHVLRVCLVAHHEVRVAEAIRRLGVARKEAQARLRRDDATADAWTRYLYDLGPWEERLYDLLLPVGPAGVEEAVESVCATLARPALRVSPLTEKAEADFRLAARINVLLAEKGHDVEVACDGGEALVTLNRYTLRLKHLEREVAELARSVPGVSAVETRLGPRFVKEQPRVYPRLDLELPSRVLLVDDEREFVHTLSERLGTRNLPSAVAYDGEEALSLLETEEPEVMVLDLKMPGIDGMEVLRRVKRDHPGVEVIILTGHGSEKEEAEAQELGAFAYLHKPADIDLLARTMKAAYQRVRAARQADEEGESG